MIKIGTIFYDLNKDQYCRVINADEYQAQVVYPSGFDNSFSNHQLMGDRFLEMNDDEWEIIAHNENLPSMADIYENIELERTFVRNPAKCNDNSFSASPFNKKGTCTWHDGVQGSATQAEYNASQSRVRYLSPKGYTGGFAPAKGKTKSSKPQSKPVPLEETLDAGLKVFEDNQFIIKIDDEHFITGVIQDEQQFLKALCGLLYQTGKKFDPNHYPLSYSTIQQDYNALFKNTKVPKKQAELALEILKKNLSTSKIGQSFQELNWQTEELTTVYAYTWRRLKDDNWWLQYSNNMLLTQPLSDESLAKKTEIAIQQYENKIKANQELEIAEQMEKEQKAKDYDLGGYEKTLTPMQLGKLVPLLTKKISLDNQITTYKDKIISLLNSGATVKAKKGSWSTYKKGKDLETKEYKHPYTMIMEWEENGHEYSIDNSNKGYPKTVMKWALWLYNNKYK
jgi:hypothetical protein